MPVMSVKKRLICSCAMILLIFSALQVFFIKTPSAFAADTGGQPDSGGLKSVIIYFYVSPCSSCEKVAEFFDTLDDTYTVNTNGRDEVSKLSIIKFNYSSRENFELIAKYFRAYAVPGAKQAAPIVFIGGSYLQGDEDISAGLQELIKAGYGLSTLMPDDVLNSSEASETPDYMSDYQAAGVFFTGLISGFNPCSLSILLFFLSMVVSKKKNVLKLGLSFIAGKFIMYIALGTLLYGLFSTTGGDWFSGAQLIIKIIMLIVAGFLVVMNIRDFFAARNEKYDKVKMQLPAKLRKFNHGVIKKITMGENTKFFVPICFGLGAFISVGEFLCTGQIYLATIIYVFRTSAVFNLEAVAYFLLYGIAFIIPLLILTVLIHKGKEIFDVSEMVRGKLHIIKLVNAAVFLIFTLIVIFFF